MAEARRIVVLLSFYRFSKSHRWWAFRQMGLAKERLGEGPAPQFVKFLGTGAGEGFSMRPDLTTYAHLTVWNDADEARAFLRSPMSRDWQARSVAHAHIDLNPVKVHGEWNGKQPFSIAETYEKGPLAVMTRARIRAARLVDFWRHVPQASRSLIENKEVLFAKGIGEMPWIEQATFSLWPSKEAMRRYAYDNGTHREVIQRTRQRNWYSEELFAEFVPRVLENDSFLSEQLFDPV
ncbi:MAG: hypothetical protein J4F31_07970 [Flavobacteriales bacterium]|nr:hypothetical protein [Flavobacteriales bacterium]